MNAEVRPIDQLRDRDVARDARQLVGLVLRQASRFDEEVDHLLDGRGGRDRQVGIGGHRDVVGGRLGAGPWDRAFDQLPMLPRASRPVARGQRVQANRTPPQPF